MITQKTTAKKLLFKFVADEINNPSRSEEYLKTAHERYVRLSQIYQFTLARNLLHDSYEGKIVELFEQYPERAIYLAATLNSGRNPTQHAFSKLCLNLLARSASRFSSEEDTLRFIEITRAAIQGAKDGNSPLMFTKITCATGANFISRLRSSPQTQWAASKQLCDTSETLKNLIPLARETFGPRHQMWQALY